MFGATPDGRRVVLAVADGVSAATHSHLGARSAARAAVGLLSGDIPLEEIEPEELARAVARRVRSDTALREIPPAGEESVDPRSFATTLSVAVIDRRGPSDMLLLVGVGDSPVYMLDRSLGVWDRLAPLEESGERSAEGAPASTATAALPTDADSVWCVRRQLDPHEAVFVMSDGLGSPLGPGGGDVGDYLAHAWQDPPDPLTMAMQAQFHRRTFNDDRSVVAAWLVDR